MTLDPLPRDLPQAVAALAVLWAALQLILARWRDLAPLTVALTGAALTLSPTPRVAAWALVALGLSAIAQARGARYGVGRPAVVGLTLVGVAFGALLPIWAPAVWPGVDPDRLRDVALMPIGLAGVVGGILALERAGTRPAPSRWVGRIPVDQEPPPGGREPPTGSGQADGSSEAHVASSGTRT